jgi:PAS domain S-box-containing protein
LTQYPGVQPEPSLSATPSAAAGWDALEQFLKLSPQPIIVTDDQDCIRLVNMPTIDWLGIPPETIIGGPRDALLRIPGIDVSKILPGSPEAAELLLGLQGRIQRRALNEPARQTQIGVSGGPYQAGDSNLVIWILNKPVEAALGDQDAFSGLQENLLDQVSFAVLLVDANGKPFFRNKKWIRWVEDIEIDAAMLREIHGGPDASASEGNVLEAATAQAIRQAIQEGNYDRWIEYFVGGFGVERWFEINLRPIAWEQEIFFCVEIADCTERHQAQDELQQSEQRFRDLAEISSDWFWETDADLRLSYISDRFFEITAISPDRLMGKTRAELIPEEMRDDEAWLAHWRSVLAHEPFRNFQYVMKNSNKVDANISLAGKPIFDEHGVFLGYRGVGAEIAHLLEAEKSKRIFDQRVEHAQRLEALGTLAGGIAHDINNALLPVINMVKMVSKHLPAENTTDREMLQVATEAANHCKVLVRSILDFSRQQDIAKEACDMTIIVREAVGMLRSTIPSIISLETHLPTRSIRMIADGSQIKQILVNLAKNAADAIGMKPGKIVIDCSVKQDESVRQRLPASIAKGAHLLKIVVRDSGQGMDEATKARIFEPFFTTKAQGDGTGLGLAIVHSVVKSHDGIIEVESTLDIGTTFTIYLPLGSEPAIENVLVPQGGDVEHIADR